MGIPAEQRERRDRQVLRQASPNSLRVISKMPYTFDFAPSEGILRCIFDGIVTDDSLQEYYGTAATLIKRLQPRSAITDFSPVTSFEASSETIQKLARSAPVMTDDSAPRFIVAPSAHMFGMARMFQLVGEHRRAALRVVRSTQEVYAALGVKEPCYEPISETV
jgi:hypothetical protein